MKVNFKTRIVIYILLLFIFSFSIMIFNYNKIIYSRIVDERNTKNISSLEVINTIIAQEEEQLKTDARTIARDQALYHAIVNKINTDINEKTNVFSEKFKFRKINKYSLIVLLNNLKKKIVNYEIDSREKDLSLFDQDLNLLVATTKKRFALKEKELSPLQNRLKSNFRLGAESFIDTIDDDIYFFGLESIENYIERRTFGELVINKKLDITFINKLKNISGNEIILLKNNKIRYSTLPHLKKEVIEKSSIKNKTLVKLRIKNTEYAFSFIPIYDYDQNVIAYIGSGFLYEEINSIFNSWIENYIINLVFFAIILIIFLLLIIRVLFKPFNKLLHEIDSIKANTADKIHFQSSGEFAIIIKKINELVQELKKRELELQDKNEKLKDLDRLKDEFLSNITHELRTPINGIIGISESLYDGITGELNVQTKDNLALISSSGKRLSALVDQIMQLSSLKSNNIILNLEKVSLYDTINSAILLNDDFANKKNIEISNLVNKNNDYILHADKNKIIQILFCLINNAIKYSENGKIVISTKNIDNTFIEVFIKDHGVGIPKELQCKIFDSFTQGDGSLQRVYGGSGIGLSLAKQLIELHGGSIRVESEANQGSIFSFTIKLAN